jgi:hypothetical protein
LLSDPLPIPAISRDYYELLEKDFFSKFQSPDMRAYFIQEFRRRYPGLLATYTLTIEDKKVSEYQVVYLLLNPKVPNRGPYVPLALGAAPISPLGAGPILALQFFIEEFICRYSLERTIFAEWGEYIKTIRREEAAFHSLQFLALKREFKNFIIRYLPYAAKKSPGLGGMSVDSFFRGQKAQYYNFGVYIDNIVRDITESKILDGSQRHFSEIRRKITDSSSFCIDELPPSISPLKCLVEDSALSDENPLHLKVKNIFNFYDESERDRLLDFINRTFTHHTCNANVMRIALRSTQVDHTLTLFFRARVLEYLSRSSAIKKSKPLGALANPAVVKAFEATFARHHPMKVMQDFILSQEAKLKSLDSSLTLLGEFTPIGIEHIGSTAANCPLPLFVDKNGNFLGFFWHGTNISNQSLIRDSSFRIIGDLAHGPLHGARYGRGGYFASEACKSLNYAGSSQPYLLLFAVFLGKNPYFTDRDGGVPPGIAATALIAAPQCVRMDRHPHYEFVIFDERQAAPLFSVIYL